MFQMGKRYSAVPSAKAVPWKASRTNPRRIRTGPLAGLRTLLIGSPCWKPPRQKSCRVGRSPCEAPKEVGGAGAWCEGGPQLFQGMRRNFEALVESCQKEISLPSAGSERRKAAEKRCPSSLEMLFTNRRASE